MELPGKFYVTIKEIAGVNPGEQLCIKFDVIGPDNPHTPPIQFFGQITATHGGGE